ncbi:MAG: SsrA-binding protein SmpB [Holosporales bacterium]|jgi:SsrA-binding protein|nr:SsrA-binding protein SmpB [Holosporales bacterium]
MSSGAARGRKVVGVNRRAHHDYTVEDTLEAGIVLVGSEVKSLRAGRVSLVDAFAVLNGDGELTLINAHIPEYQGANRQNHDPKRARILLVQKKQKNRLIGSIMRGGYTLVPLSLYFSTRGWAKVELALCRGKKQYDKRAAEKERDWKREKERLLRDHNRG